MKKTLTTVTAVALLLVAPATAQAKTYHIVGSTKTAKISTVGKYGYRYHRLATIKCPYAGCRSTFHH